MAITYKAPGASVLDQLQTEIDITEYAEKLCKLVHIQFILGLPVVVSEHYPCSDIINMVHVLVSNTSHWLLLAASRRKTTLRNEVTWLSLSSH